MPRTLDRYRQISHVMLTKENRPFTLWGESPVRGWSDEDRGFRWGRSDGSARFSILFGTEGCDRVRACGFGPVEAMIVVAKGEETGIFVNSQKWGNSSEEAGQRVEYAVTGYATATLPERMH